MQLDRQTLIEKIEQAYELDSEWCDIQDLLGHTNVGDSELLPEKNSFDEKKNLLEAYFANVAGILYSTGAFESLEKANSVINIYRDARRPFIGPDGVVPDDGALNPHEEADGIICLLSSQDHRFQVPIAHHFAHAEIEVNFTTKECEACLTSKRRPLLVDSTGDWCHIPDRKESDDEWLWLDGTVIARQYHAAVSHMEKLVQEFQGALILFGLAFFRKDLFGKPPGRVIGRKNTFNSWVYINSISARLAPQVIVKPIKAHGSDLDRRRLEPELLQIAFRHIARLFERGNNIEQQATRMFLRSFDTWSDGEQALFLATALEGLTIDKKNRDDISGRLQEAVTYWIGGNRDVREKNRKLMSNIYATRSSYVHNGDAYAKAAPIGEMIELTREVIVKAIRSL